MWIVRLLVHFLHLLLAGLNVRELFLGGSRVTPALWLRKRLNRHVELFLPAWWSVL